ncbi:MAG: ABC transporter substrate-binding protein, partial [Thermomicrobiales bacterium]|nr:ABC transporter substrate-binding protein [Thermomicrobiales bacterium]
MSDSNDRDYANVFQSTQTSMDRRDLLKWLSIAGGSAWSASMLLRPDSVFAQDQDGEVIEGGTFQMGIADISSLNPFVSNSQQDSLILNLLYPAMGTLDENSNRLPLLAESWETSEDGMTNTFHLREGFLWEDGVPVTAHDVKFTCDLEIAEKFSFKTAVLAPVESIEAPDDYTVVFNMARAVATFNYDVAFWFRIMPKHIWENIEDPKSYTNDQPIGSGAFRLTRWAQTQFVELEARKDYDFPAIGRPPIIDSIIYRTYPDVNTLVLAFQNGDIDAVPQGLPVDSVESVAADDNFEIVRNPSTGYNYIAPNIAENPHLASVTVRQAMAMGIDKDVILQFIFKGSAGRMTTVVSPVLTSWFNPDVEDWPFDIEAGRQLLEETGYTDTDGSGFVNTPEEYGGNDLVFRLSFAANSPTDQKVAAIMKENWEKMGISIELDPQES